MTIVTATEKARQINLPLITASCAVATTTDIIVFPSPGIFIRSGWLSNYADGTENLYGWKFNSCTVDGAHASTVTSILYDGATANTRTENNFFVQDCSTGEIMYVVNDSGYDSTGGTLTVIRGCLGTTATTIGNNDVLNIMNSVSVTNTFNVPVVLHVLYNEIPSEPRAQIFG